MGRARSVPDEDYTIPLGKADVIREGGDVTVVALAWLVHEALAAAEALAAEGVSGRNRRSAHARAARYRDDPPIGAEERPAGDRRTKRADPPGFQRRFGRNRDEDAATFARLKAPVRRVCALPVPIPYAPVLESHVFPDRNRIAEGIRQTLQS